MTNQLRRGYGPTMLMRTPEAPGAVKPLHRIQENLLARSERRLITAICARLPAWVKPDHLTSLGLFGALLIGAGYWASKADHNWLWLSVAAYFIHWFGDSLDGSLARFRQIERPRFGYFIDHSTDALGTLMIVGGLGLSPYVKLDVALVALAGYYLLSIHAFLAARVVGEMKLSYVAAGPTELRIMLIGLTIAMYAAGKVEKIYKGHTGFDLLVGAVATILIILFVVQTTITARRIQREGEDH